MDRQRIINLFAAISTITVFGFALGLMFPLLALIMESAASILISLATTPLCSHWV
jgi:hypothetical protein